MYTNRIPSVEIGVSENKLKLAAIFFDKVLPVHKDHSIPKSLVSNLPIDYDKVANVQNNDKKFFLDADLKTLSDKVLPNYFKYGDLINEEELNEIARKAYNEGANKARNIAILEVSRQVNLSQTCGIPIFNESIFLERMIEDYKMNSISKRVEIELINAPIIDTNKISWDQISDAKQDPEFVMKAKRFALFINKNYQGKEFSYIVDDLSLQLEDYKSVCCKHGIEVRNGAIKSLADSKSFFGTMGLVLCSVLINVPEAAIITGVIGGALEVLKMKIIIKEVTDKYHTFVKESPISLIHEVENWKING